MVNSDALREFRGQPFFESWRESVPTASVDASEEAIRVLIDRLLALGLDPEEEAIQQAVHDCVEQFNQLDDGWIMTIEREDICDCLGDIVELCGLDAGEEWVAGNRDW